MKYYFCDSSDSRQYLSIAEMSIFSLLEDLQQLCRILNVKSY